MNKQVADICDENQDKMIQVLSPKFKNFGKLKRFTGQIETIKIDKSNFHLLDMLKNENGEGKVIIVDNAQNFFGVVGDKLTTTRAFISGSDVPVFTQYESPNENGTYITYLG